MKTIRIDSAEFKKQKERHLLQVRVDVDIIKKLTKLEPKNASNASKVRAILEHFLNSKEIALELK